MRKVKVKVDGVTVEVPRGRTVLQACELATGERVPRFCFQRNLKIAGNCRMCLVEVKGRPKPVASCAMPVMGGPNVMEVFQERPLARKARESVMEFLLIQHPLDCPICDQGGECDLQDQRMHFGSDRRRYYSRKKRRVLDKEIGPVVSTVMTRCIHCTRCVRFLREVVGSGELMMGGRGGAREIGTYRGGMVRRDLRGNLVDLCPVGALTAKPYAFRGRRWEAKGTFSLDTVGGDMTPLWVELSNDGGVRVQPAGDGWISDWRRFAYDGVDRAQVDPYELPLPQEGRAVLGEQLSLEDLREVVFWAESEGIELLRRLPPLRGERPSRWRRRFRAEESEAETLVLVGTEGFSSLQLAEIRQCFLGGASIISIGRAPEHRFFREQMGGNRLRDLVALAEGRHGVTPKLARGSTELLMSSAVYRLRGGVLVNSLLDQLEAMGIPCRVLPSAPNEVAYAAEAAYSYGSVVRGSEGMEAFAVGEVSALEPYGVSPLRLRGVSVCRPDGKQRVKGGLPLREEADFGVAERLQLRQQWKAWSVPEGEGAWGSSSLKEPRDFLVPEEVVNRWLAVDPWRREVLLRRRTCRQLQLKEEALQRNHG